MNLERYQALVIGATGAVGSALVRELLASPHCDAVTILTRRHTAVFDHAPGLARLQERVIDFEQLEDQTADAARDRQVAFCTLGVGQPRKMARKQVWKIDVDYTAAFGRGLAAGGVRHVSLLSAAGADPQSGNWYFKVKGAAEEALKAANIPRTSLFRPSLLATEEIRYGLQDRLMQGIFPRISWLLPSRFHEIRVEDLGRCMRMNAERPDGEAVEVLHYQDFVTLLGSESSRTPLHRK